MNGVHICFLSSHHSYADTMTYLFVSRGRFLFDTVVWLCSPLRISVAGACMSIIGALSAHNHIPGILSLYCSIVLLKYFFLKMTYTYSSGNPLFKIAAYCVIPFRDNILWYLVETWAFRGGYRASGVCERKLYVSYSYR